MTRTLKTLFALAPLLILCGCMNYKELRNFDLAAGIAIDREKNGYTLTIELLDLSGSPDQDEAASYTVNAQGPTVPKALENARRQLSVNVHLGNMEMIVIGKDVARDEGLLALMDWFTRDTDVRESVDIVIARDVPAKDILSAKSADLDIASHALEKLVHPADREVAQTVRMPLYRISETLQTEGKALVLPAVGLSESEEEPLIDLDGLAVFRGDRLTGFLEQSQVTDYMYLMNTAENRLFVFETGAGSVSVTTNSLAAKRSMSLEQGSPVYTISLHIDARMDQAPGAFRSDDLKHLEETAAAAIHDELEQMIGHIQTTLRSDILHLGYDLYLKDKVLWDEFGPDWSRDFEHLHIRVDTSVSIQNTGQLLLVSS